MLVSFEAVTLWGLLLGQIFLAAATEANRAPSWPRQAMCNAVTRVRRRQVVALSGFSSISFLLVARLCSTFAECIRTCKEGKDGQGPAAAQAELVSAERVVECVQGLPRCRIEGVNKVNVGVAQEALGCLAQLVPAKATAASL